MIVSDLIALLGTLDQNLVVRVTAPHNTALTSLLAGANVLGADGLSEAGITQILIDA
jgi:hypothetical protein